MTTTTILVILSNAVRMLGDTSSKTVRDLLNEWLARIEREVLPSGSGFDRGTKLDLDASAPERLVFTTDFHHMGEGGAYCGWSSHIVTVTPSFIGGFVIDMDSDFSAVDYGSRPIEEDFRDYVADTFRHVLRHVLSEAAFGFLGSR